MQLARFLSSLAALLAAVPAAAILIRPDRDDAEYLELATRYTAALALDAPCGEGVLIAPRWVLTIATRARDIEAAQPRPRLAIAGRAYEIEAIHRHPASGLGLLALKAEVAGVKPTPLYRLADELGKPVVFVGHGPAGKLGGAASPPDKRKRAAINTVDRIRAGDFDLHLKHADEASDLQGSIVECESGSPAFIENRDGLFVAGVGRAAAGEWNTFIRVSPFVPWIEALMRDAAAREAAALMDPDRR